MNNLISIFKENWAPILTIALPLLDIIYNLSIIPCRSGRKLNKMNSSKEYPKFKITASVIIVIVCLDDIFSKHWSFNKLSITLLPFLLSYVNSLINTFNYSKVTEKGIFFDNEFKKWSSFTSYTWSSPNSILFKGESKLNSFELELIIDDNKTFEMDLLLNEYMPHDLLYKDVCFNEYEKFKQPQQNPLFKNTITND